MTFLDLFSGIGGFRLGMEMAGHECVGHCEIDKFAEKSYQAMHRPKEGEWNARDIRTIGAASLPRADAWCFGFPCQDISVAGNQKGLEGNRSGLFFTVTGLLGAIEKEGRPKCLLIENVKNLLSVNRGYDFARLLVELDEIGYDAEWDVLNSKDFGVPQNRERAFIVGHLRGRRGRKVFPIAGEGETANAGKVKQIGNVMPTATRDNPNQGRVYDIEGIAPCLNGMGGGGREPMIVTAGRIGTHQTDLIQSPEGISRALKATDYKNPQKIALPVSSPEIMNKTQNGRRVKGDGEPMFTLTARDRHGVILREKPVDAGVTDGPRIRKLTPRECFRLQGFPDEYFERAAKVNSDTQLYKQAGNSVTVNVIYEIAKRLE